MLSLTMWMLAAPVITDFSQETADLEWYVVNDNVMGGRSEGGFSVDAEVLRFRGRTNTNGGGFSSIRTGPLSLDLANRTGVRLRVRGDGRRYTFRLATSARFRGREIGYWADFEPGADEWQEIEIPFDRFVPRFRGQRLGGPKLNLADIRGMGIMIYDGKDGAFALEVAEVGVYSQTVSLDDYRWEKRVLVVNGAGHEDERVRQQLERVDAAAFQSAERDLEIITLLGSRQNPQWVSTLRKSLNVNGDEFTVLLVGKDGSVKLRRSEVTALGEIHALIDTMPMRQREMSERL
ncbi:MAG: CIA30 family protein [Myxococcota bacterium]